MKTTLDFLNLLQANNNKPWFDAHREMYLEAKARFEAFVQRLIDEVVRFDPSTAGATVKECVFRIYRDTRFSHNKNPYKTHMGALICPHGRNSGYAGYYFHIEAHGAQYIGGHLLAAGAHMPMPKELESIRTEILDNPQGFVHSLETARGFELSHSSKLQRVPKGFPSDSEWTEYFKYRDYSISKPLPEKKLLASDLLEYVAGELRATSEFVALLNRAIEYAKKEM
ncbi:MAG: DUF2461 domain-containing protein [Rikenellaceae bacterium]|jgi:uncharacterized protein (TIGR02453 family)|nr:DUF2461 domain-containing protein [Rikenellaceae bacterium]